MSAKCPRGLSLSHRLMLATHVVEELVGLVLVDGEVTALLLLGGALNRVSDNDNGVMGDGCAHCAVGIPRFPRIAVRPWLSLPEACKLTRRVWRAGRRERSMVDGEEGVGEVDVEKEDDLEAVKGGQLVRQI